MNIRSLNETILVSQYGGKAYWLSWLKSKGYAVPKTVCLPATSLDRSSKMMEEIKTNPLFLDLMCHSKNKDNLYEVAIRSSGVHEDGFSHSLAGHYDSFVGKFNFEEVCNYITKVINSSSVYGASEKVGVIIQQMIGSEYAGVGFSSNPLNGLRTTALLSLVKGFGGGLLAGKETGEDLTISKHHDKVMIPNSKLGLSEDHILDLWNSMKKIEDELDFPVDIEWCVEYQTNTLYFLQARPILGVLSPQCGMIPIKSEFVDQFPASIKENHKVKIRLDAEKFGIKISNGYLVINNGNKKESELDFRALIPEKICSGFSVVLLEPATLCGKVVRDFANREAKKHNGFIGDCQRYKIRTYLSLGDLCKTIRSIEEKCFEYSWKCITIIQEIFSPSYTGIAKRISNGFVIEIARGHFVPKGVVPTSQYFVSFSGNVEFKLEVIQQDIFDIVDGQVSKGQIDELVTIEEGCLHKIIRSFEMVLLDEKKTVEFGLLQESDSSFIPYLIDLVDDGIQSQMDSNLLSEGVISPGKITGRLIRISDGNPIESLGMHFHDQSTDIIEKGENVIVFAKTPDISLLRVANKFGNRLGFIFEKGSALSHLPVVLREKGIPAIILNEELTMQEGIVITLDSINAGKTGNKRISYEKE